MKTGNKTGIGQEYVSISGAAIMLGVSIDTVRRWEKAGKLKAKRINGKNRAFAVKDLHEFAAAQSLSTTEVAKRLKISPSSVRRLEDNGMLKPVRAENGRRGYSIESLEKYQDKLRQAAEAKKAAKAAKATVTPTVVSVAPATEVANVETKIDVAETRVEEVKAPEPQTEKVEIVDEVKEAKQTENIPLESVKVEASEAPKAEKQTAVAVTAPQENLTTVAHVTKDDNDQQLRGVALWGSLAAIVLSLATGVIIFKSFIATPNPGTATASEQNINGATIKPGTIDGDKIADGAIKLDNLSDEVKDYIKKIAVAAGKDGKDGKDGRDGAAGEDGKNGASGKNGKDGVNTVTTAGTITEIMAGAGLNGGGTEGSVNLSIVTGDSMKIAGGALEVALDGTGSTTATTNSASGLETTANGLRLIGGCSDGQILKWDALGGQWVCGTDSTNGLGGTITVSEGGTGRVSFTPNGVIFGNGTGSLQITAAGTAGQLLLANGSGTPTFTSLSGDLSVDGLGVATIGANTVDLGSDTVGNYVASLGTLTGLQSTGNTGEGSTPTLTVVYGNSANTAVQGDTTLTCTAGSGAITGGGNVITLGTGGTCGALSLNTATLDSAYVNTNEAPAAGDISGSFSGGLVINNDSIVLGTKTTGNYVASFTAGNGLTGDATGEGSTTTLNITSANGGIVVGADDIALMLQASGDALSSVNASGSGLEVLAGGLTLLQGCTDGQILKWNESTDVWYCANDLAGGGALGNGNYGDIDISGGGSTWTIADDAVALGTKTTGNYVASFTAGNGLTGDATGEGSMPTLNIVSANGAIQVNTDDLALVLQASADALSGTTSSGSGLEVLAGGLTLLQGCTDGQILKWNELVDVWYCAADDLGGLADGDKGDITVSGSGANWVIDADSVALGTDTTGSYVASFTAGAGLTGDASGEGSAPTLAIGTANGGITVNADDIALTLQSSSDGLSNRTSSGSGLEILAGGLTLLQGCTDGQVLKWNELADVWYCADDADTNTQTYSFGTITTPTGTDPVADSSTDTLALAVTGTNLAITGNSATDTITFDINEATLAGNGLGSSGDALQVNTGNGIQVVSDNVALGPLTANWNQTGAFDIFLNNSGSELVIRDSDNTNNGTIDVGNLSGDATYTFSGNSGMVLTDANYASALDATYVNDTDSPAAGDITGTFASGFTIGADAVALGADTTGAYVAGFTAGNGLTGNATGEGSNPTLNIVSGNGGIVANTDDISLKLTTVADALSNSTSSSSGMEILSSGVTLLQGCNDGQLLKWNETSDAWQCSDDTDTDTNSFGFSTFSVPSGTDPVADSITDTLGLAVTGTNLSITGNSTTDTITFDINEATLAGNGLGSSGDALQVNTGNGIQVSGDNVVLGPLTANWNQTGAFDIVLNNSGSELIIRDSDNTNNGTIDVGNLSSDAIYTFSGLSGTVLTDANYSSTLSGVYLTGASNPAAGDISGSFNGGLTIGADAVALGTDTTGNYVASIGTLTGLSVSGNTGEGSTPGLSVTYGSGANTAVQGNMTVVCPAGSGNLSGGGNTITLGAGGTCSALSTAAAVSFATSVSTPLLQNTGALTLSTLATAGSDDIVFQSAGSEVLRLVEGGNIQIEKGANDVSLTFATPSGSPAAYNFSGASGTVLTSANYSATLGSAYLTSSSSPTGGAIGGSFGSGLSINNDSIALGTKTTGNYVASITAGNGLTGDINSEGGAASLAVGTANAGIAVNADNIALTLQGSADALSSTTSSGSGLEITSGGLSLLQGCANNEILKWNETSDAWQCGSSMYSKFISTASTNVVNDTGNTASQAMTSVDVTAQTAADATEVLVQYSLDYTTETASSGWHLHIGPTGSTNSLDNVVAFLSDDDLTTGVTSDGGEAIIELDSGQTFTYGLTETAGTSTVAARINVIGYWAPVTTGADLAENYYTTDPSINPGDVVALDPSLPGGVRKAKGRYDPNAIGVVSTQPGIVLDDIYDPNKGTNVLSKEYQGRHPVAVALAGRIPVNVSTENGPIKAGDYLTPSSIPGIAMKATKSGQVLGQALFSYDHEGVGAVMMFVKNTNSNGSGFSQSLQSVDEQGSIDYGQAALSYFMRHADTMTDPADMSEIYTDRIAAGLEIVTPKLTADEIDANKIKIGDQGISFTNTQGQVVATLDANGKFTATSFGISSPTAAGGDGGSDDVSTTIINNTTNVITGDGGLATVTDNDDVVNNLTVNLDLLANGSLKVAGPAEFKGTALFDQLVTFGDSLIVEGDATFKGTATFNSSAGGYATVGAGQSTVHVTFDKPYKTAPVVGLTLGNGKFAQYSTNNVTSGGFDIILSQPAASDLTFSWTALSVSGQ